MICEALPPASTDPQLIEVIWEPVQALVEYTPMFGPEVIVPPEDKFWLMVMAAIVVTANASPIIVIIITVNFDLLASAIFLFQPDFTFVY
jgi:hypothetical protein